MRKRTATDLDVLVVGKEHAVASDGRSDRYLSRTSRVSPLARHSIPVSPLHYGAHVREYFFHQLEVGWVQVLQPDQAGGRQVETAPLKTRPKLLILRSRPTASSSLFVARRGSWGTPLQHALLGSRDRQDDASAAILKQRSRVITIEQPIRWVEPITP